VGPAWPSIKLRLRPRAKRYKHFNNDQKVNNLRYRHDEAGVYAERRKTRYDWDES
jgi:hypothetical protein